MWIPNTDVGSAHRNKVKDRVSRYDQRSKNFTMIEPQLILMGVTLSAEVTFGFFYNRWVQKHQAANEGVYTAFYVTGGTLATVLIASLVIGLHAALLVLAAFGASGLPMILGSMYRHTHRIQSSTADAQSIAREILHGTQAKD
jgi:hypothetical protein